ncbi:MAG: DUF3667 domain-containing protein [Betaproteobacteria bacterium]
MTAARSQPASPDASSAVHATPAAHHATAACANCGAGFAAAARAPRFCPDCGQETTLHPPSVGEFVHEFVGHYIAFEGALWKTLGLLVLRPGRLTIEYLVGRRRRYVLPLRLYLSASFLFFLAVKVLALAGGAPHASLLAPATPASAGAPAARAAIDGNEAVVVTLGGVHVVPGGNVKAGAAIEKLECTGADARNCNWFERKITAASEHWRQDPERSHKEFSAHWMSTAPYAVFLMLPVFAAIVSLAYRGRRMLFGEHVVFSMHMHAFWFLVALAAALLPDALGPALLALVVGYDLWALRSVYGGGWGWTMARGAFIFALYGLLLSLATAALTLVLVLE